jgi:phytanoyl-CoA hydroxylase
MTVNDKIKGIAASLGYQQPQCLQSMVICKVMGHAIMFKQPKIGGKVPGHQDSTFLFTEPISAVGFWFALENCTPENGCMWFSPGSHKSNCSFDS